MKKKSRFLTGLLSAVMALSLFALPASAAADVAGGNGTGSENAPAITDVWGDKQDGSIIIHKYEFNGVSETHAPGTKLEEKDIPVGAKALDGVKFKIYKVQDRATLAEYYSGKDLTNNEKFKDFTSVDKYYTEKNGVVTITNGDGDAVTASDEQATVNGVATFKIKNAELGLYLVVETYAPDKVKEMQTPFLVSVPMKNPSNQTTWLYDVHVYPKNATQYGGVTIKKLGVTGNETGTPLEDVTFELYKENADNTWIKVEKPDNSDVTDFNLTTNDEGKITIKGLSKGEYKLVETTIANNEGYIITAEPIYFEIGNDGALTYTGKIDSEKNIVIENYRPDLDKQVYNDDVAEDDKYVEGADYSVGDKVPYKITVKVPQNIKKLKVFTVTDTPVNLKDDVKTITITTKNENGEDVAVPTSVYTVAQAGSENGFTITFDPSKMESYAGKTLVISYEAVLQTGADMTTNGNKNNAKLTYTNKIDESGKGEDGSNNTIEDETVVYTFAIRIKKTKEDGKTALPDAKFDLYKDVTDEYKDAGKSAEELAEVDVITGDAASAKGLDKDHYWKRVETGLTSGTDGLVTTEKGLANGTYYLVETEAPEDYNLLSKPVEVKLNVAYKYSWKVSNTYDQDGNLKKHETSQKKEMFDSNEAKSVGDKIIGTDKSDATDIGVKLITVINRKGFDLPVTGGFGTLLFSGIGALLVVGGVGVLMSTKKKKKGNA